MTMQSRSQRILTEFNLLIELQMDFPSFDFEILIMQCAIVHWSKRKYFHSLCSDYKLCLRARIACAVDA